MILLPGTTLSQIFSYLDPFSLIAIRKVCGRFKALSYDPILWTRHFKKFTGTYPVSCTPIRFIEYIRCLNHLYYGKEQYKGFVLKGNPVWMHEAANLFLIVKINELIILKTSSTFWAYSQEILLKETLARSNLVDTIHERVLWVSSDNRAYLLNLQTMTLLQSIKLQKTPLKIIYRENRLLTLNENKKVDLFDLTSGKLIRSYLDIIKMKVWASRFFVLWMRDHLFKLDLNTGMTLSHIPFRQYIGCLIYNNRFDMNNRFLVSNRAFDRLSLTVTSWRDQSVYVIDEPRGIPQEYFIVGNYLFIRYFCPIYLTIWNLKEKLKIKKLFDQMDKISFPGVFNNVVAIYVWKKEMAAQVHFYDTRLHTMVRIIEVSETAKLAFKEGVLMEQEGEQFKLTKFV